LTQFLRNSTLLLAILLMMADAVAQSGGRSVYTFLNTPHTARIAGLGGSLIMIKDDDAALGYHNPSLLNASMHQQLNFNSTLHVSGINNGFAGYTHHLNKLDATLMGGIQYFAYGQFDFTNSFGQSLGTFSASEYALNVGIGKQYSEKFSYGANLKVIYSSLESYNSLGAALDLGGTYQDTAKMFSIGLTFKNMGYQITKYHPAGEREPLPFDVQLGIAKQLKYLPLRFSITYHDLQRWNIRYKDPNADEPTSIFVEEGDTEETRFAILTDNFFRHFIVGLELLAGKKENFRLRAAYNHQRRVELGVDKLRGLTGFSGGVGLKIKQFRIEYGISFYHLAGATNHFTITTNLSSFKR